MLADGRVRAIWLDIVQLGKALAPLTPEVIDRCEPS